MSKQKNIYHTYAKAKGDLFDSPEKTDKELEGIQSDLENAGVRYCIGTYVDIHGLPKGKFVPLDHFHDFARGSELYTGYAVDGIGQHPNDDEIASVPDIGHIIPLPWKPELAWMPADNTLHGKPYELNTRVLLQKILKEAHSMGLGMNLGVECELFLLKLTEDNQFVYPTADENLVKSCYDFRRSMIRFDWIDKMACALDTLGWDLYSFDHEDASSQFEFDFNYCDALTMCDRVLFFREMAKHYAEEEGLLASFMPKPLADKTGSGAHFNMSLYDLKTGDNLFKQNKSEDPYGLGLSKLGYQFTAGLLKHGPALCAAFAPTVNSYKRLVRRGLMAYYSWAPVFNSYGTNNRTNSIRIPMAGGRVESRNADAACNPYLACALALAAGLQGIKDELDPGKPQEENLYEFTPEQLSERGIAQLPRNLLEAVEAFQSDDYLKERMGDALHHEFVTYKSEEWRQYHQRISQWEIDHYARLF